MKKITRAKIILFFHSEQENSYYLAFFSLKTIVNPNAERNCLSNNIMQNNVFLSSKLQSQNLFQSIYLTDRMTYLLGCTRRNSRKSSLMNDGVLILRAEWQYEALLSKLPTQITQVRLSVLLVGFVWGLSVYGQYLSLHHYQILSYIII